MYLWEGGAMVRPQLREQHSEGANKDQVTYLVNPLAGKEDQNTESINQ